MARIPVRCVKCGEHMSDGHVCPERDALAALACPACGGPQHERGFVPTAWANESYRRCTDAFHDQAGGE